MKGSVLKLVAMQTSQAHPHSQQHPLRVRTTSGWVEGTLCSEGVGDNPALVRAWRGVPFAAETSGARRYRAPEPAPRWDGVRDCTEYGPAAPQPTYSWTEKVLGSEDCLHLDIVRPNNDEQLPVVVYFHGGSFILGSSHMLMLRGLELAANMNCVYVSVNFRLGALGYLDVSSLAGDAEANPAMRDHIAALEWVRENIAQFGGDPESVTAMGESAGGAAVLALMAAPAARGLFHRAIAQSPPIGIVHSREQSAAWVREFLHRLALPRRTAVDELRKESAADLVRAGQSMLWRSGALLNLNSCYAPTIDGELLPEHPIAACERGAQAPVPLIIGTNADEASFSKFMYQRRVARTRAGVRMLTTVDEDSARELVHTYGPGVSRKNFAELIADALFWAPAVRVADAHAARHPTWMYRFDFAPKTMQLLGLGAVHSAELATVFGTPHAARAGRITSFGAEEDMRDLTARMQSMWAQFIHGGTPGAPTTWPAYTLPERHTQIFDATDRVVSDPKKTKREAWAEYTMLEWATGKPQLLKQLGMLTE